MIFELTVRFIVEVKKDFDILDIYKILDYGCNKEKYKAEHVTHMTNVNDTTMTIFMKKEGENE